jgi:hydroxyethylthiazole kinase-like uncharacterized protein yjeF
MQKSRSDSLLKKPQRIIVLKPLPGRAIDAHKGTFGRVLIVGGNAGMIGAPAFAGLAAYRSGCGYVQIATPRESLLSTLTIVPEAIGLALPSRDISKAIQAADAVVIGPGLGQLSSAKTLVSHVLSQECNAVIDADALNIIAAKKQWPGGVRARCVLTPHPGEMKRLGRLFGKTDVSDKELNSESNRIDTARRAACAFGQVMVLKGFRTVVTDGESVYINHTGTNALARAGSGDMLSGIIASLMAQGMSPLNAACSGVWIHGTAGASAAAIYGPRSTLARDVIGSIAAAIDAYATTFGV